MLRASILHSRRATSLALLGESGSGKSTLLHLVGGLDDADVGDIVVSTACASRSLGDAGRAGCGASKIGVVFQQFNLIPSLTVADNLAFQARLAGRFDAGVAGGADRASRTRGARRALSGAALRRTAAARRHRPRARRHARGFCSPTSRPEISTRRPATRCSRSRSTSCSDGLRLSDGDAQHAARRPARPAGDA